jgi:glycosyltransferase involved in cell wall biosynthesis
MRILFFLESLELGGAERQALLLAESLRDVGYEVIVWGFGAPGVVSRLCREKDIPCFAKQHIYGLAGRKKAAAFFQLALDMRAFRPDIILPYCTYPNTFSAMLWRIAGARACFWQQRDAGLGVGWHREYPFALNLASAAIANSEAGAIFLKNQGWQGDIVVIHNGARLPSPQKSRREWREELGIEDLPLVACMVANLSCCKNHGLCLRAWRRGLDEGIIPHNAILVFAGRKDGMAMELEELTRTLALEPHVKFLGFVGDISGLLSAVDIGILSSVSEGLPNAVIEYMQAGLPVVASDIPGVREVLGTDSPNALFAVESAAECATALGKMFFDASLRKAAGQYNRDLCEGRFSVGLMRARYEELFQATVDGKRCMFSAVWPIARYLAGAWTAQGK